MTYSNKPCHKEIAQLIRERLDALHGRKSVAQIAHEAGHQNENLLLAIAAGQIRVGLDHAVAIGTALELDPLEFYCKVLECWIPLPQGVKLAYDSAPVASRPSVDLDSSRPTPAGDSIYASAKAKSSRGVCPPNRKSVRS